MELTLKEYVDINVVDALINEPSLKEEQVIMLKGYKKKYNRVDKCFEVPYFKVLEMGRSYATKSCSLQNFKKKIRHTLCNTGDMRIGDKMDIDIVNCHPVLMSQYCKKNNINCDILDDYIHYREDRLKELMTACQICREDAKLFVIKLMYLSKLSDACINIGIATPPPPYFDELAEHFQKISQIIVGLNPDIYNKVKKSRKKEHTNKAASCVSYVIQIIEDDIIMKTMSFFKSYGFIVETLCFDGVIISCPNGQGFMSDSSPPLLGMLSTEIEELTTYKVRFEKKPMEDIIDLQPEEYDFSDYDFEHINIYNQLYCSQLKGDCSDETYALRKTYIEHFLCKIQCPDTCFIFQNGDLKPTGDDSKKGEKHYMYPEPHIYSAISCSNLFKPIMSGKFDKNGVEKPFWDEWIKDPAQRCYRKYDFIPYNRDYKPPEDVFNLFMGFNPIIYDLDDEGNEIKYDDLTDEEKEKDDKILKIWFDLTLSLCGDNREEAPFFHYYIANIFQHPEKSPPICIIFKGKQGTGKNMVLDVIGNMIGQDHYITSSNPKDFFGEHAEGFYRKLLANINEAEGKDTFDFEGKIKSFITEDTITVNPKFVRPTTVMNFANLVITTNKPCPIPIDVRSVDRRMTVYENSDRFLKYNSSSWTKIYQHFRKPLFMKALYRYYMHLDISKVDWRNDRPITKAYREMCSRFIPTEVLFFEEYIDETRWNRAEHDVKSVDDDEEEIIKPPVCVPKKKLDPTQNSTLITIKATTLFSDYEDFCRRHRFRKENNSPNSKNFKNRLVELEFPLTASKVHNAWEWKFVPKELYDYMVSKRWVGDFGTENIGKVVGDDIDDSFFDI